VHLAWNLVENLTGKKKIGSVIKCDRTREIMKVIEQDPLIDGVQRCHLSLTFYGVVPIIISSLLLHLLLRSQIILISAMQLITTPTKIQ